MTIKRIVGLGGVCQVAFQVKRRFGFHHISPFDWLVTPLSAIENIFDDDGRHLGFDAVPFDSGRIALSPTYGIAYHHEFKRYPNGQLEINAASISACASKLSYKYKRFCENLSDNEKTLFIRMIGHHEAAIPYPYVEDPKPTTIEDINNLAAAIGKKFPGLTYELAFVYSPTFTKLEGSLDRLKDSVRLFTVGKGDGEWYGEAASWDPIFDSYNLNLDAPTETMAEGL